MKCQHLVGIIIHIHACRICFCEVNCLFALIADAHASGNHIVFFKHGIIQIHIQLQHFIPAVKNQCLCGMLPVKCGRKSRKLRFLICNFIGNIRRHNRMLTCLCTHSNAAFPVISHSVSRIFCRKCVIKRAALSFIPRRNKRCLSGAEQITQILSANTPAVIYVTYKGPMVCKTYDIAGIRCLQTKQIQIFIKYDTHVNPPVCFLL